MKKHFFKSLFLGAFALVGMIGISSCSDKDDPGSSNPQFNKETQEVATSFVINVSAGKKTADTRQTDVIAQNQATPVFRGLNNAIMLTYAVGGTGTKVVTSTEAAAAATKRIDYATLLTPSEIKGDNTSSHKILDLALPVGTDAMLFYGVAPATGTDAQNGKITFTTAGDVANSFNFALTDIVSGTDLTDATNVGAALAAVMTEVINADDGNTTSPKTWKDIADEYSLEIDGNSTTNPTHTLSELERMLGMTYLGLTTIQTIAANPSGIVDGTVTPITTRPIAASTELRAGSTEAIVGMFNDFYKVYKPYLDNKPGTPSATDAVAYAIADNIVSIIDTYFTADTSTTATTRYDGTATGTLPTGYSSISLANYPTSFGLPYGTALMTYDATTISFAPLATGNSITTAGGAATLSTYNFPAELMYYANSGLRTADTEKAESDFPNGITKWITDASWTGDWSNTNSKVTPSTRAAALQDNVTYGTALLETKVALESSTTNFWDNTANLTNETVNKPVDTSNLELVGVLVGGQPAAANWEFLPNGTTFNEVIYDPVMNGTAWTSSDPGDFVLTAGGPTKATYTMVLDNYNSGGVQDNVRVALEFKNHGPGFYGRDNFIREGGTFYLVGVLDLSAFTSFTAPVDHVFVKDYMTTATFTLTDTSLQNAYVTVPDLRSGQVSFGLSVDIGWKTGLSFSVDLGTN